MNMQQSPGQQQPPVYPGATPIVPPKKPWFKKWWVWLIVLVVIGGIGNALGGGDKATPGDNPPAAQATEPPSGEPAEDVRKEKLTLDDGWTVDKSGLFVEITGYVSNNTDKAITTYVQITFDTLDAQGANLGTCLANTNTIDAGGKWKFKATCLSEKKEIAEVRFKEISGF